VECLDAFLGACGNDVDLLKRTRSGANALQLARASGASGAMLRLEQATEDAALSAQEQLLQVGQRGRAACMCADVCIHAHSHVKGGVSGARFVSLAWGEGGGVSMGFFWGESMQVGAAAV
jgi:hypothetical protein